MSPTSPPPFDAVFFDLDGTLADTTEGICASLHTAFAAISVAPPSPISVLVDGSPLDELFAASVPKGTPEQFQRFALAYRDHYEASLPEGSRLFPGVRETIDLLVSTTPRVPLAVVTTKRESSARALLEALGLRSCFERIAGSGGTAIPPKPSPALLLSVAKELGHDPARVLMVGDTLRDVLAGQRAGMKTAAVTYGLGSSTALAAARPDFLLEEFDELLLLLGAVA